MEERKWEGERGKGKLQRRVCAHSFHFRHSPFAFFPATRNAQRATRNAITLIEILISLFVLLFGLMGVAAIFPVASHYLVQGDQKDRSDQLANNAFAEIEARGMLKPENWAIPVGPGFALDFLLSGNFMLPASQGYAFVLDPMGIAAADLANPPITGSDYLPVNAFNSFNPWQSPPPGQIGLPQANWPVRRLSFDTDNVPGTATLLQAAPAETIFRLRDDLAVEQPNQGDRPAMQRWSVDNNGTPNNLNDDVLLARQYVGDYSWLATVVPTDNNALLGLQPAANLAGGLYDVSVVVFYKRDIVPSVSTSGSPGSERLIAAEFLNQGELAIYDFPNNNPDAVDLAVDGIRPTNWICVMGVNQTNGQFLLRWYRILAMDEDTEDLGFTRTGLSGGNAQGRLLMVSEGGDWPTNSMQNLRVAILPGAIHVKTRQLPLSCECCE